MNVWDFARRHMYPYTTKGSEIVPKYCPFCKGGKNHDQDTFALNTEKQTFNCKRGSCNRSGHFTQLCKEFGERADNDNYEIYKPVKVYKKPTTQVKEITSEAESYLGLRKISKATMDKLSVGCDNKGNIVFPYYENGEVVFVKFRPARKVCKEEGHKKAWRESETKPVLWGMQLCDPELPLIITEGEIDTLSIYEAGLSNIVSVPSGSEDFTWIETCWEWLQRFDRFILFGDSDGPGKEMVKKIIQKLGAIKCSVVECEYKDANELLYYKGADAVVDAIAHAKDVPIYGLVDLADIVPLDVKNMPKIKTGIRALDESMGGCRLGELTVWTGKRGEGKSTLMGQMMIEAIEYGNKVCVYSGELKAQDFQYWINLQAAGRNNVEKWHDNDINKDVYVLKTEVTDRISEWYRGKFFIYDNKISASTAEEASILKVFEHAVKKYDVKMFLVDNLMTAKYDSNNEKDFYLRQINFVRDLVEFASNYNVHVHLVAHPKKTNGSLGNDDISGRAEITNLAHNVLSVERLADEDKKVDVAVKILKNRWQGAKETVGLNYCPISRRMYQPSQGPLKSYGWEKIELKKQSETEECPF